MTDITLRCTAPNVGVDVVSPTHDMKLTDEAGNSVGLIYCDRYGRRNPVGVNTGNMPRSPIRISTGSTGYSDQEPPFITEVQSTWVGGRAQADLSTDRTRFADSFRLDTTKQYPICAPAVIAQQGAGSASGEKYITGTTGLADIANTPVACKFPAIATAKTNLETMDYSYGGVPFVSVATKAGIDLDTLDYSYGGVPFLGLEVSGGGTHKTVSGFTLSFYPGLGVSSFIVYYDAVVSVDAPTYEDYDNPADYAYSYNVTNPYLNNHYLSIEPIAVPANSNLWLMVYATYPDATTESILVRTMHDVTGAAVYEKASGSADWGDKQDKYCFYGWVHYEEEYDSIFFEYRKQMYVVMSTLEKNKSELYMNGYRGFCASNSANLLNTNIDASGLQTNELADCIIYLIAGPGSQERRPWRKVVSNTALGVCVMDKPWKIAHTVDTEYVVLGLNKWQHIPALDGSTPAVNLFTSAVKTVTVVGDYVVFGFGTSRTLVYFKVSKTAIGSAYYIKNDFATDAQYADVLQTITDKYGITKVWRARGAKVDSAIAVDWASPYTTAPTLVFDINYEERENLYLQRDRLYVDLYKDILAKNKDLADMDRQKNDLIREITQIIGSAGTINTPGTYTYHDGVGTVTVDSYLKVANANYATADDTITALKRKFDDLTLEHNRILADYSSMTNDEKDKAKYRDEDIFIEKSRIAGLKSGSWAIASPSYTFANEGIAHNAMYGSSTPIAGTDLADVIAEYANAKVDVRELTDRAYAIIGTGTIDSPGTDSELKRVFDDIAYETARLAYESAEHNTIYRQILDLTYQISNASNTDLENTATSAIDGVLDLAAHADRSNWVNAKYLPTYIYAGDKVNPVTNIVGYGDTKIPYIFKTDSFGSISDGVFQELPIGEMKTINSILNGTAAMQFGVYLYFNLEGGMIERYYDQRLDDVGPNRDEGLPVDRQGEVTKLLPYPGRYYAAIDAGSAGYSSILCNNMLGEYSWHEIWRSTTLGDQIYDVYVQTIPGFQEVDRLWIATTGSIIAVPIAITPVNQYKYEYFGYGASSPAYTYDFTTAGWVETSWIDFDVKSVDKYFHSVTIFSDYTGEVKTGDEYKISVYFKVDGDVEWSHAGDVKASEYVNGKFEVGVKELQLQNSFGSISGKKIKFRVKMIPMADVYESPRLKAIVVNAILRLPSKRTWTVNFLVDPEVDLNDKPIHDKTGVLLYWLNKWANSKTYAVPLTMNTNDYSNDNVKVMIDPASLVTYDVITDQNASKNKTYKHIGSLTLYEV